MKTSIKDYTENTQISSLAIGAMFEWHGYVLVKISSTHSVCVSNELADPNDHHQFAIGATPEFLPSTVAHEVVSATFYVRK